ncbi:hypothetical protein [Microbacterium sp. LWS13-1.2]|uniref:DUF4037 domain-containing protein n=1 Tax=Microbacterium sp. LWS13-1.2 TaxID=3135264 RepID=A0AAU6SAT9_9MICO
MRFALLAGAHTDDFVVIGGLNPEYLAPDAPVPHQGTTDVDLLFALGFDEHSFATDFAWLDDALTTGGFTSPNMWRWDAMLGDAQVRLEFLCDVWDHTADTVPLPGSRLAVASKLAGPAAALFAPVQRELSVPSAARAHFPEAPKMVSLRFANLGSYLLAKAAAVLSRVLRKDKYDLMYVTLYNAHGGAAGAARVVAAQLEIAGDAAGPDDIREAMTRYLDLNGSWAGVFAEVMRDTGDTGTDAELRADAAVGARRFLETMDAARAGVGAKCDGARLVARRRQRLPRREGRVAVHATMNATLRSDSRAGAHYRES